MWTRTESFTLLPFEHWARVSGGLAWTHGLTQNSLLLVQRDLQQRTLVRMLRLTHWVFCLGNQRLLSSLCSSRSSLHKHWKLDTHEDVTLRFHRGPICCGVSFWSLFSSWFWNFFWLQCFCCGTAVSLVVTRGRSTPVVNLFYKRGSARLRFFNEGIFTALQKFEMPPDGVAVEVRYFVGWFTQPADWCRRRFGKHQASFNNFAYSR